MNNLFADIGSPQHYFKPVWCPNNQLMGVEIMTRLADKDSPESLTHRVQMALLDEKQQIALFNEKITLIEKVKNLLFSREITVWVNINDVILTEMMQDPQWVTRLQNLPFLTLMIKEEFPGMNFGRNNLRLIWLAERFSLALANLGSGKSSNRAVFDGLFQHIFLEQRFIHNRSQRLSFIPFTNAIIRQIAPFCDALIVSGIDDIALYNEVKRLGFTAMRGSLWPAIAPDNLPSLLNAAKNPAP